jgi:CRISPR-associated protein Cas1
MATLYLDRSGLEVRADGAALALYQGGERVRTVPFALLDRVVFQGTIQLETSCLGKLAEAGVAVLILSPRQSRRVAMLLGPAHNDAAIRLGQYCRATDPQACAGWAHRLVLAKARAQARLVGRLMAARPDCRKPLFDAVTTIRAVAERLASDGAFADTGALRGMEGACAAAHFRGLAAVFPESLGFTGRNRRPPRDPVNAALSLGYTLVHFEAVRAAHAAGLDPLIGLYHRPAFGRESLASDLVEPLRPRVDGWVWALFRDREMRAEDFAQDKGACLLQKAGRGRFYQAYEAFVPPVRRLLRRQCRALAEALRAEGEPLLDPGEGEGDWTE